MNPKSTSSDSDTTASYLKKIADSSSKEFKTLAVELIETLAAAFGLSVTTQEYSLIVSKRSDALFTHVLIEYEPPGSLSTEFDEAKTRIIQDITSESGKEQLKSFFGIILSEKVAFVTFSGKWIVKGPYTVDKKVILKIAGALRGLTKKKLCEQELIKDFGSRSEIASKTIKKLYDNLENTTNTKVLSLFQDWLETFSHIGYEQNNLHGLDAFYFRVKDCTKLLFCIHTYYAILVKIMAAELACLYHTHTEQSFACELIKYEMNLHKFKRRLINIEKLFKNEKDFERDCFSWYLEEFDTVLLEVFAEIAQFLSNYEYMTPFLTGESTDVLRTLYQELVPGLIRHNLGEYYTPDWLAQCILDRVEYTPDFFDKLAESSHNPVTPLKLQLLDPACGSGTFLVEALKRMREYAEKHDLIDSMSEYIGNIRGIDCNPLAVLTARTNYLLCVGDLLLSVREIPVYCADSLNSSDPLLSEKCDYVVGNPPWVLWDNLPRDYRTSTKKLWNEYGLFTLPAAQAHHGGGKKDISILFTYVCCDKFLKDSGTFGFLITQSVFKTKGAGEGFRKFKVKDSDVKVIEVHDFVQLHPFEGARNRTAAVILKKGGKTLYPVRYLVWDFNQEARVPEINFTEMRALPSDPDNELSPWITVPQDAVHTVEKVCGKNAYPVYEGINSGGANGVYWVRIVDERNELRIVTIPESLRVMGIPHTAVKHLFVENIRKGTKKKVEKVKTVIEDFFVYPLLKSKNVGKWKIKGYTYMLQMQDPGKRIGVDEDWVRKNFPKTYTYLKEFEEILLDRAVYKKFMEKRGAPFYTMYNIGVYTYAPYKVVWSRMGSRITACVTSSLRDQYLGDKCVLPDNVLAFIPTDTEEEAHYICSIMNSCITDMILRSIAGGTKSFGIPRIVEDTIKIPKYDSTNKIHRKLSALSEKAHEIVKKDGDTREIEEEINNLVADLYMVSEKELCTVKGLLHTKG